MKNTLLITTALLILGFQSILKAQTNQEIYPNQFSMSQILPPLQTEVRQHPSKKIKLALILDTSNSMDGLIDQAKSQLWGMVNKLADAKCDGMRPSVEIALYEYGNDNLNANEGFIRLVSPLTSDLDEISQQLFSLKTKGGSEHCGQVISTALDQLKWTESSEDLQVIFIAGNEPFNQGPVNYYSSCQRAKQNKVTVNTIFCGNFQEGINSYWKKGASITNGEYMSINQNSRTVYIETPYDEEISEMNDQLNDTYIHYGSNGLKNKEKQMTQDSNAESYGLQNKVSRTVSKSKQIYKNSSWDLVDAAAEPEFKVEEIKESEFSDEMKSLNMVERKAFIKEKSTERNAINSKISELAKKRAEYISTKKSKQKGMLNDALISAITKQANEKRFEF